MFKRTVWGIVWLLTVIQVPAQYSFSGRVLNEEQEPLGGANVVLSELNKGVITDQWGRFTMRKLRPGAYTLHISFIGYETVQAVVELREDLDLGDFRLVPSVYMGEEVLVTAIRAGERTPVSYTSLDEDEIRARNFGQDIPYLLSMTPSLVTTSDAGHGIGYTGLRIRGTDANRINVTVNGVPLNDAESHSVFWVDLPDFASSVDNVQIQRGVGTSTNGAAAFGASINFQTRKLEKDPYARYDGTFGSFATRKHSIAAGTGILHDHFTADLRLSTLHSDGYIDRSRTDLKSWYLSGSWFNAKTLVKFITFSGVEELYQAWNGVPSFMLDTARTYNALGEYTDADDKLKYYDNQIDYYKQEHYQLHFSRVITDRVHVTSAVHYTSGAGYYEQYREDESLEDYLMEPAPAGGGTVTESDLIRRKWLDNDFYGFTASGHYSGIRFTGLIGGGWNRYDGDHFGTVIWAQYFGNSEIRHRWYENNGLKSDWNTFAKGIYEAGERLSVFADVQFRGIRYTIEGIDDDLRDITQEHAFLFFNPKAGLDFRIDPRQEIYALVARAGREPNRDNFVDADPERPSPVEEILMDYEIGYRFKNRNLEAGVNYYFMDYTNQLVLTGEINDVGAPVMTNIRDSYRTGLELTAGARIFSRFSWGCNMTLSRNRIRNYRGYVDNWDYWNDPANESYQFEEELGTTDLSFSPSVLLNNQFDAEPLENFHLNLSSRYVGKQYIDNTASETRKLDPYFISDLRMKYEIYPQFCRELSLQLQVLNLFNARYESNAWIYRYIQDGEEQLIDGYFPQAGIHFMAGISLIF